MLQFLGFLFFLIMFVAGFWGIIFLSSFAMGWAVIGPLEIFGYINKDSKPEDVRRKTLPQQDGITVLYSKA